MSPRVMGVRQVLGGALLVGMASAAVLRANQRPIGHPTKGVVLSAASPPSEAGATELFAKVVEHSQLREAHLKQYAEARTYEVRSEEGKVHARTIVKMQFQAPATKVFTATSEEGSWLVRNLVFKRLMESEAEAAAGRSHRDSSISPENYTFRLLGREDLRGYHCFVFQATPRRKDKYLFEGKVWVDGEDFAIVQIAGQPARSPSFWIKRVDFVRQYQKIGEFWLPMKDESMNELRIHGKKVLTIDHRDCAVGASRSTGSP